MENYSITYQTLNLRCQKHTGYKLRVPNNAIFGTLNALGGIDQIIGAINTDPAYAALAPFAPILEGVLRNPATIASISGTSGVLGSPYGAGTGYNIFNGEQLDPYQGAGASVLNRVNSFEVGYKGVIAKKLSLGIDIYTYEQQGFTNFTAIGPAYAYTPDTAPTGALAQSIAGDLAALLTPGVTSALTTQYTGVAAQLNGLGIPIDP